MLTTCNVKNLTLKLLTVLYASFVQITKELDRFSLSSEVKLAVLDCIWPRQEEVRRSLVLSTAAITNSYLKDFDWKVKVSEIVLKSV